MKDVDEIFNGFGELVEGYALKYNKFYIGMSKEGLVKNFIEFKPKKSFLYLIFKGTEDSEKIRKIEDRIIAKNPVFIHFLFMLLPLPKDTYAWIGFYSKESLPVWFILTYIFRFPHIFVYTFGGELLMEKNYAVLIAGAIFAILVYSGLMIYLKKKKVA